MSQESKNQEASQELKNNQTEVGSSSEKAHDLSDHEKFWFNERKKVEDNPYLSGKLWKQTWKDMKSLAGPKHPKALYAECLKQSTYWDYYASDNKLSVDDLAMIVCRDLGKFRCRVLHSTIISQRPYMALF